MDMLPTNIVSLIEFSLEALVVVGAIIIVAFNYFHVKEAKKMERKLNIFLPGSVGFIMHLQMLVSLVLLTASIVFLILI